MEPRLKWNKSVLAWVTNGSSSGLKFFKVILFQMEPRRPARVVRWLDHLGAMCSRAWHALCAVGSRFNSNRGPGKERPPT